MGVVWVGWAGYLRAGGAMGVVVECMSIILFAFGLVRLFFVGTNVCSACNHTVGYEGNSTCLSYMAHRTSVTIS